MNFGTRLKALRKQAGLTQEALASACGYSGQARIGNYESGGREPRLDELPVLARGLKIAVADFFEDGLIVERPSQTGRPDPSILAQTQEFLETAFAFQGKQFEMARDADLFADAYEWLAEDDRPVDGRNLVDFGRWMAARRQQGEGEHDEQSNFTTGQAASPNRRRTG